MTIKAFLQLMRLFLFITFSWLSSSIDWLGLVRFGWVPWPVVDRGHSDSALPPALSLLVTLSSLVFLLGVLLGLPNYYLPGIIVSSRSILQKISQLAVSFNKCIPTYAQVILQ